MHASVAVSPAARTLPCWLEPAFDPDPRPDREPGWPLLATPVPAGFPSPATDYAEDGLDLNGYLVQHPAATFLFSVQGHSMQGAGILGSVRIPDDLALVGYDDIDFAQATVVPLSSVRQPAREIGATAAELLFETLAAPEKPPRQVRFRPELVVRASTAG